MSSDVLLEEFEVLESIYPTELSKLSERDIQIDVEPDDIIDGHDRLKLTLTVHYTDEYPDVLPELSLNAVEGTLEDAELEFLLEELKTVGEENLGMAMTFTLVSHLREELLSLVHAREENRKREEVEKERLALQEEEARTRGTPITVESFKVWKMKFDEEQAAKKAKEDEEKLRNMTPKEREESKRVGTRLSGRQLFERDRHLEDDDVPVEEGTVSVDFSQYERTRSEDEEEEEGMAFSDSD